MIPIVLVSDTLRGTNSFLKDFVKKNKFSSNYIFEIKPLLKEFSIGQIREIKKEIIYNFSEPRLYILHDFDTASFEAQNAFLKTLEEHQQTIQFVLVVRNPHKLAGTVLSRSKIVSSVSSEEQSTDEEFERALEQFLKSHDLKILGSDEMRIKQASNLSHLFKSFAIFFKRRLPQDPKSSQILREILSTGYLVENNHVDLQAGIDRILLRIRKVYSGK